MLPHIYSTRFKTSYNKKFPSSLALKDRQATPVTLSQVWLSVSAPEIRDVIRNFRSIEEFTSMLVSRNCK
jgi:hypothetical protein